MINSRSPTGRSFLSIDNQPKLTLLDTQETVLEWTNVEIVLNTHTVITRYACVFERVLLFQFNDAIYFHYNPVLIL